MTNGNKKKIWVSDIIGDDYKKWKDEFVVLDCGTGCGKTFFCINRLGKYARSKNRKILYLCNRTNLRNQIYDDVKKKNLIGTMYVTSYQSLQKKLVNGKRIAQYDYIICDECHYFTTDATFNNYTDISYNYVMSQTKAVVLFVSATAKTFFKYLQDEKKVKAKNSYRLDKNYSYVDKLYFYQNDELSSIINDILENESDSKIVVFCNVGDRIKEMEKIYKDTAQYYCSKSAKDRKLKQICGWLDGECKPILNECIKNHSKNLITFDKRILFTTSVLDNGVDLKDEHIKHVFTEIVDIDTMIQSLGRKRSLNEKDTCTFYIREYQKKGIQGFINQTNFHLEPVKLYKENYQEFYNIYGNRKERWRLQKNDIFYSSFKQDKSIGQIKINECKYRRYLQNASMFSAMKEMGYVKYLEWILPQELVDKCEKMIVNVEQIDLFREFLESLEGKRLFANDIEYIKEEFKTTVAIKLSGKSIGISTLNGQLQDLYENTYTCRFYNKDAAGKRYVDKRRVLNNGNENPNRDKHYWILEDRQPP